MDQVNKVEEDYALGPLPSSEADDEPRRCNMRDIGGRERIIGRRMGDFSGVRLANPTRRLPNSGRESCEAVSE